MTDAGVHTQSPRPRFSIIISTFERRDVVVGNLRAFVRQEFAGSYEVIVVVDGSTDGTAAAVRALSLPYPLRVLEHANAGLSRSRNRGAEVATGELLLFLDDDMEADPRLLAELDRSHREGADVAFGPIPLHPASPPTILAKAVGSWADQLAGLLANQKRAPSGDQIFAGQICMRREVFDAVDGFDTRFAAAGSYGNEDLDIGYRIAAHGFHIAFNPRAVSQQFYATPAAVNLRQYRRMGHADVAFARKHPELTDHLFNTIRNETREHRRLRDPVLLVPRLAGFVNALLAKVVTPRVDRCCGDRFTARLFFAMRTVEYWRGVHDAGGIPCPQAVRVLCYHAVDDLTGDPVLADYGVPEEILHEQIETLTRCGYRFISAGELVSMLESRGGVPRRALLLTFDDAYRSLLTSGLPVLRRNRVAALAFAISGELGGSNRWDQGAGARSLPLLDVDGLRRCMEGGIDIGAHSRNHRSLPTLTKDELEAEIAGSVADLERAGLPRPDLFAYPFGEHDATVRRAARAAGLRAAFTVDPGLIRPGDDRYALRRFEIYPSDRGLLLRWRVATAGRIPLLPAALRAELWRRRQRARRSEP